MSMKLNTEPLSPATQMLQAAPALASVKLAGNPALGYEGARSLLACLHAAPQLTHLDLRRCPLERSPVQPAFDAASPDGWYELDLGQRPHRVVARALVTATTSAPAGVGKDPPPFESSLTYLV
jgi:hypothetical protein